MKLSKLWLSHCGDAAQPRLAGLGLSIPLIICYSEKYNVDSSVFTVRQSKKNWMSNFDENFQISRLSFW